MPARKTWGMIVEDQSEVVAFLQDPATHSGAAVERIETHISIVILAGHFAYKLKRSVRLGYLDFSRVELRSAACRAEIALNSRTAPHLYLEVRAIRRDKAGRLHFGGEGALADSVVVMRRFDQAQLFDRLARHGSLSRALMIDLADRIVAFHRMAEIDRSFGGHAGLAAIIDGNEANLTLASPMIFDANDVKSLTAASREELDRLRDLVEARRRDGKVRLCHGDLHLRNVCLIDGEPTLFDCIEFNREIACVDVLYDLSFLLMDLAHRQLPALANAVFNRYFDLEGEVEGVGALPLYLSIHAAIRAHVTAAAVRELTPSAEREERVGEARAYLDLAWALLQACKPRLIAIGGLSGTGKSTLAYALAPHVGRAPGARVLRSDVLRKRLMGVSPETHLPPEAYGRAQTESVYASLADESARLLHRGRSVIVDAVFLHPAERARVAALAEVCDARFEGLWLEAAPEVLTARIAARRHDASDATVEVLRQQLSLPPGQVEWQRIDASGASSEVLDRVSQMID